MASPAWDATIRTVPVAVKVTTPPASVAGPESTEYVIANPLDAVAAGVTLPFTTCPAIAGKVIVCAAWSTFRVRDCAPARKSMLSTYSARTTYDPAARLVSESTLRPPASVFVATGTSSSFQTSSPVGVPIMLVTTPVTVTPVPYGTGFCEMPSATTTGA